MKKQESAITESFAATQIGRLVGLNFFPSDRKGQDELIKAARRADTKEILTAVIDDWIQSQADRPTPYDLGLLIAEKNITHRERREKCDVCSGAGFTTVWKLVTYSGNSFNILRSERLPDIANQIEANDYAKRLHEWLLANPKANRQVVTSAATLCQCRIAA